MTISGTIFNDANGLTDNTINGTPVTAAVLPAGTALYVALVNDNNRVSSFAAVAASGPGAGTYTLTAAGASTSVVLTTNLPVVGMNPMVGLPSSLAYTGEGTLLNGDGQEDGVVGIAPGAATALTVNFGINRRPQTAGATLTNLQYKADGTIAIPAAVFTGSDAEDAPLGYPNNLAGRRVDLYQGTGGMLYYMGVAIIFQSATVATSIQNFDPAQLTFSKYSNPSSGFSFSYSVRDNANTSELVPSTVTYSSTPLPIALAAYSAGREGSMNLVRWTTATEENTAGFAVERSADGVTFIELGRIRSQAANGTSARDLSYRFEDAAADASQTYYYRIRENAFGGQASLSPVMRVLGTNDAGALALRLTPNPTSGPLQVSVWQSQPGTISATVVNVMGRELHREAWTAERGTSSHPLSAVALPAGSYFLKVRTATGDQLSQAFTVAL